MMASPEQNWNDILENLKESMDLSDISFDTWIRPLKILSRQGESLSVLVPVEPVQLPFMEKRYLNPLRNSVFFVTGEMYDIKFVSRADSGFAKTLSSSKTILHENSDLNPYYSFDNFVVGGNNRFAYSASLAVAESPGEVYNPLFLYGGVGLGKTHLMHSIAHYISSLSPDMKVMYVSSETFTNELIDSIRNGNNTAMSRFRDKYRNVDVLLVDDVQFIIGKDSTQEEFFHTFNILHTSKKQIILSSDRPPKEMETLEERIRSRFEWGLLADIGSPEYETRMAILRKKAERDLFPIDDDILNYIAINIKSNIRELEGALNKLRAFFLLTGTPITMDIATKELSSLISPDTPREITAQIILEVVSDHFGLSVDQIMSRSRSNDISRPRQIAMYLCASLTDLPLVSIGKLLGRDHSTVVHGINKVRDDMSSDKSFKQTVNVIQKKLLP